MICIAKYPNFAISKMLKYEFCEICYWSHFEKQKYFLKQLLSSNSPDHVLQDDTLPVHILRE